MDNVFMATLKIKGFTEEDISENYRLNAKNEFGEKNFDITLSTKQAPPGKQAPKVYLYWEGFSF